MIHFIKEAEALLPSVSGNSIHCTGRHSTVGYNDGVPVHLEKREATQEGRATGRLQTEIFDTEELGEYQWAKRGNGCRI